MTILQKMLFFVPKVPKTGWANICPLTAWGCRECDCLRVKSDIIYPHLIGQRGSHSAPPISQTEKHLSKRHNFQKKITENRTKKSQKILKS